MKLILACTLLCFAALVSAYDPNYCDPFPSNYAKIESSCMGDLSVGSNEQGILLNAFFPSPTLCDKGESRSVRHTLNRVIAPSKPVTLWTFSYSIKWTDAHTNCVLGPSGIGLDQNGLSNDPLTDISSFALNQWYTRQFTIEPDRMFNVSFACASNVNGTTWPFAIVKDVYAEMGGQKHYTYKPSSCMSCPYRSVDGAQCLASPMEDEYGRAVRGWVYLSNYVQQTIETGVNLNITDNLVVNEIYLAGYLAVGSCIYSHDRITGNSTENKIKLYIIAGRPATLVADPSCPAVQYEVIPLPYYDFPGMPTNRTDCKYFTYDPTFLMQHGNQYFYISEQAFTCQSGLGSVGASYIIVAAVVPSVIVVVAIAIGAFFAIRKHKKLKAKKEKKASTGKTDPSPATMSLTLATIDDISDRAVHH